MNNAHTFQRIVAYLIDLVIISFLLLLLTNWIPKSTKYQDAIKKENTLMEDYVDKKINESEFIDQMYETKYTIDKESYFETLISVVLHLGYFAGFVFYNKGQTLGKKAMNIKIVSKNGKEASYRQLLGRALIHNGCFASILSLIFLLFIKSNQYSYTIGLFGLIQSLILVISAVMMIYRKDKKGLHDLICGTKVVE